MSDEDIAKQMKQEELDQAIADSIYEGKLRTDIQFAINQLDGKYNLCNSIRNVKDAVKELYGLGHHIDLEDLFDIID